MNKIGVIDCLGWDIDKSKILIIGYCYIEGLEQNSISSSKKSILLQNNDKKYILPLTNQHRNELKVDDQDYTYAGFSGLIDLNVIDNVEALSVGDWTIQVYLNTSGYEEVIDLEVETNLSACSIKTLSRKSEKINVNILPVSKDGFFMLRSTLSDAPYHASNNTSSLVKTMKSMSKLIRVHINSTIYSYYKKRPVDQNKILFLSQSRTNLNGNFEFVHDEIKRRGDYNIVFYLSDALKSKVNILKKMKYLKDIASAKYILLDDFYQNIYSFHLREETELIQLWHACGAFKTFGFSRVGKVGGPPLGSKSHRNYTKAIVSSTNIRKCYAEGFGIPEEKVYATGVPRTDIFFDEQYKQNKINELENKYPLIKGKKVILFAPTFRGNGQKTAYYDFDKFDIEALYQNLSKEYIIINKLHPFVTNVPVIEEKYKEFIIDLSCEREINDLLFISDILITDYSSVCFEYSLLNKPMIFFAYDMEEYISSRDFYYPYKEFVPGVITRTTQETIDVIKNQTFNMEKLETFRNTFFNDFDGKSTQRVVDLIFNERG